MGELKKREDFDFYLVASEHSHAKCPLGRRTLICRSRMDSSRSTTIVVKKYYFAQVSIFNIWILSITAAFINTCMCAMWAKSLQSCPTLCDPMDGRPPGSSVHGILQAGKLKWAATPSSGDLLNPRIEPTVTCLLHQQVGFYHWATWWSKCP